MFSPCLHASQPDGGTLLLPKGCHSLRVAGYREVEYLLGNKRINYLEYLENYLLEILYTLSGLSTLSTLIIICWRIINWRDLRIIYFVEYEDYLLEGLEDYIRCGI